MFKKEYFEDFDSNWGESFCLLIIRRTWKTRLIIGVMRIMTDFWMPRK